MVVRASYGLPQRLLSTAPTFALHITPCLRLVKHHQKHHDANVQSLDPVPVVLKFPCCQSHRNILGVTIRLRQGLRLGTRRITTLVLFESSRETRRTEIHSSNQVPKKKPRKHAE